MCTLRKLFALALIALGCSGGASASTWIGQYAYSASLGKTAAGTPVIVDYTLTLGQHPMTDCRLVIQGYQVNETIRCNAAPSNGHLDVRFKSYGNGSVTNQYGVAVYPPKAILLSLERQKKALMTHWRALSPGDQLPKAGHYFHLVVENQENAPN